jgi:flagellar motility protein MotE (MotC chaperone)
MKFLLPGVIGLVLVAATVATVLMVSGSGTEVTAPVSEVLDSNTNNLDPSDTMPAVVMEEAYSEDLAAWADTEEIAVEDSGSSVLGEIFENIDFVDYQPTEDEIAGAEHETIAADSVKQASWLAEQKATLAAREAEIGQREQMLQGRERELLRLEDDLNKKLLTLQQAETSRVSALAKLYDGMDAQAVASLMNNLDDETVVALLPRMKAKTASSVLAMLPPQRAAKLSQQMITISGK